MKVQFVEAELLRPLRHKVLRVGFPYEATSFVGDDEETSHHGAVYDKDGTIIAIGTIMKRAFSLAPDEEAYQLRGMASDQACRGSGAGRLALQALESRAAEKKASIIWCKARTTASGFYERAGWQKASEEFEEPHFGPHYLMFKRLSS